MQTILIIEDKKSMADMLAKTFSVEGYNVKTAYNVTDGIAFLSSGNIDAVVTDMKLPDGEGMEVLRSVREGFPLTPVIMMTAFGSIEMAVRAVKEGACDFITKPFDPDHLLLIIKRAIGEKTARKENLVLKKEFPGSMKMPEIIGVSSAWMEVMEKIRKVASLKTTVLVLGESGTGKELVARAVHFLGQRSKELFVAVNCAAIPKDLIENEIFGHEKGAFTGAGEIKPGRFELADRGTIFLDEIGDMAMHLQSKLLRALQESEFERVGGTKTIKVDLRVIAASNKDLGKEVSEGRFREDLYYRLNVFPVIIPPLRERREDIIPLARHFISTFSREMNKSVPSVSHQAEKILTSQEWKGNVRELRNVMERAVILCDGQTLMPEHFNLDGNAACADAGPDAPLHVVAETASRNAERIRIERALRETHGNKTRAAEALQVSYKTLLTKIREYGISI